MGRVDLIGGIAQAIFTLTIAVLPYGSEIRLLRAGPNSQSALQLYRAPSYCAYGTKINLMLSAPSPVSFWHEGSIHTSLGRCPR